MVLRSFHTPSRYDFRSNVIRSHNEFNKSNKIRFYLSYYDITITLNTHFWRSVITRLAFKKLRTIAWRFTVIKEELLWCFIIAFAEATHFSVSWASSSEYCLF